MKKEKKLDKIEKACLNLIIKIQTGFKNLTIVFFTRNI